MAGNGKTDLGELFSAHRGITSDKITERKKSATLLRDLLESNHIIEYISVNSRGGSKGKSRAPPITWSSLFRNVVGYVSKEGEAILKMEEKSTQSSSTLKARKKDVSDMVRAYVRAANKRGPNMCVTEVISHIVSILRNGRMAVWAANDYSWILLHYVLQKPHYMHQISQATWNELIQLYGSLILSSHSSFDRSLLSRVLLSLLTHSTSQCDINTAAVYDFFSKAILKIGKERNTKVQECFLAACMVFCTATAPNTRGRISSMGEAFFPDLLRLWGHCQAPVGEQLVALLRVQMRVHHPGGSHGDEDGGWAVNDVQWKRNMEKLYDLIMADLESASHKLRWSGKGETGFKMELIDLASDIINQVIFIQNESSSGHTHSPETEPKGKRRRTQTCWTTLRDGLSTNTDSPSLLVWLQLIGSLLTKWPQSLPPGENLPLLSHLLKLVGDTKRSESLQWVFTCLHTLALHPSTPPLLPTSQDLWSKVWTATLKSVGVHMAEREGYGLLSALIEQHLVKCAQEGWKLLSHITTQPKRYHVSLLAALISNHTLPESLYHPSQAPPPSTPSPTPSPPTAHPLRVQLLQFLVPVSCHGDVRGGGDGVRGDDQSRMERGEGISAMTIFGGSVPEMENNRPPVALCAHVLVALTQRSCSCVQPHFLKGLYLPQSMQQRILSLHGAQQTTFDCVWSATERLYLESTFDRPLEVQTSPTGESEQLMLSRESPIPSLQSLLLELLGKRAEQLLQPITVEVDTSARDKANCLSVAMETQAYHSCLILHVLFLLCICGGMNQVEQMRKTLAIRLLPSLLQQVAAGLRDGVWNELERSEYSQTVTRVLNTLRPLVSLEHLKGKKLSPSIEKALQVVRKVCDLAFPSDILSICHTIALKKSPLPPRPPSIPGSTFSLASSTHSHHPSVSSSPSHHSPFDEDMDSAVTDSEPAQLGESSQTSLTDFLSPSHLTETATCRMEAAAYLCLWYDMTTTAAFIDDLDDKSGPPPPQDEGSFDCPQAIMSILSDECLQISRPADVQMAFHVCRLLASCGRISCLLDNIMEVVSQLLTEHRKNQSILCESLKLVQELARHFGGGKGMEEESIAVNHLRTILSAFWSLYSEGALVSTVRMRLASVLCAYLTVEPGGAAIMVAARKRRKTDSAHEGISLREALIRMVNDDDHAVRMHLAKVVTSLHRAGVSGSDELLPRQEQLAIFRQVSDMLRKAHLISTQLDELSQEDDSVNRVASMIATLQQQACSSPACEPAVLNELLMAVGHGYIDTELVSKALGQVAHFLGYSTTTHFLDDHLLHMVTSWLEKEQKLSDFPFQLFGAKSKEDFFQANAHSIVPQVVYLCDEVSLTTLSSLLPSTSLPSLLTSSLPASMALILPTFAQRDSKDCEEVSQGRRSKAMASHSLLTKHLTEEEIAHTIQHSMDDFVVHLLQRMIEPHTAYSHLAHYSSPSDPEPVLPHFPSLAVRATLDYMASCYGSAAVGSTFVRQLAKKKDSIQKVLLSLAVAMETTHRSFRQRQLLQSYALFVTLVSQELGEGLEGITPFVIMDIIHTLVRILSRKSQGREGGEGGRGSEGGCVVFLCLHILTTLCKATLEACPEELGSHLQVVVATLIPYAQQSSPERIHVQALQLLILLLLPPHSPTLTTHIAQLDPFPNRDPFKRFIQNQNDLQGASRQKSLELEIERFLGAGMKLAHSSRREGLQRLTEMIHWSRRNVVELLRREESPLLQLVQALVGAASGELTTPPVAMEMGRCLGELGGLDLHCIALPSTAVNATFDPSSLPNGWSPASCYTVHILQLLTSLLTDRDISVVKASSECLKSVLATKHGSTVLSKLEDMCVGEEWTRLLQPFRQQKRKGQTPPQPPPPSSPSTATTTIDTPSIWIPQHFHGNTNQITAHETWITCLVTTLLECGGVSDSVLILLKPVCQVKVSFCEAVFPYIILSLLLDREEYRPIISRHFRLFFSSAVNPSTPSSSPSPSPSTPSSSLPPPSPLHPSSIRIMLNTVMFLRTINRPNQKRSTVWDNNFWLDLDFLDVAMAAQRCSAYFTSLLYIEIWHGAKSNKDCGSDFSDDSANEEPVAMDTTPAGLTGLASLEEPTVQQLLLEAYSDIEEPDSVYGVCASKTVSKETWMRLYEHEGKWEKSLSAYNLQMQLPSAGREAKLVKSLQNLGLTHIMNMYLCGVGVASPQVLEGLSQYQYEAAWRSSVWEEQSSHTLLVPGSHTGYHHHLHNCLLALRDGEDSLLDTSISTARSDLIGSLCSSGLESTSRVYRCLSQLLCLCELEEAGAERRNDPTTSTLGLLGTWRERLKLFDADFSFIEPILSLRVSILHSLMQKGGREEGRGEGREVVSVEGRRRMEWLFDSLCDTLLALAKMAQEAERYQVAEGALFTLQHLHNSRSSYNISASLYPSLPWKHQLQEAKLHWDRGEVNLALSQVRSLLQRMKMLSDPPLEVSSLYPSALCLYGSWLARTHSENPATIMRSYLEESVTLMEKQHTRDPSPILHAYLMLARYADSQYQRVTRHMTSSAYEAKKQLLQKSKMELEKLSQTVPAEARARSRHIRTLSAQIEEDEVAMVSLLEDKQQFLEKALHNYIHCLRAGDEHDLRVFRLSALWFANSSNSKVNTIVTEGLAQLECRKFLPLMYQLAARMSARSLATDPFQHTLQEVIYGTSLNHPHHTLYIILALSHASMDEKFPATGHVTGNRPPRTGGRLTRKDSLGAGSTVDEDKVKAASNLIGRLHTQKPSLVSSMERLCEAYIDLAYHDVSAYRKERKPIKFPPSCTLIKIASQLGEVAVPTMEIEVDPTCSYNHLVTIDKFDPLFQLAGGVNLPKVISCIGSDGKRRRQLVKGRDDLRQDAVMQQVFVMVNRLLQKEHTTSKRNLNIRTYKVIPLSQRSGVVEWCERTTPLGEYLIGPQKNPFKGAHYRYRPQDWSSMECRKRLMEAGTKRGTSKFEVYSEIMLHFRPVLHHFFLEHFPCPSEWFERRLTYTRAVATSSIVGYVVGLGDRHVQNILIDTSTAEFIHIDLGVAFEQGKTLPTPETVPFRLTRDVVDGMGVAGVEGVFRRCCEKTMEVMRTSHEELRTIVEVLLHDPLYMWILTPVKALNLQRRPEGDDSNTAGGGDQIFEGGPQCGNRSNPTNKMAERVLLRLQEKLEGIEDGVPLSISGQVNQLIQEATDPRNLCLLFPGWQPWI